MGSAGLWSIDIFHDSNPIIIFSQKYGPLSSSQQVFHEMLQVVSLIWQKPILDSGILLFLGHHLVHMHSDDDADEDANRGHYAQNWHVKDNTALFQPWKYENLSKEPK